jgi:DNA-binding beta-propeller fold protein YncE
MRHSATLAVAFALLVVAGAASGAEGDAFLKSCYSSVGAAPCTALGPPFSGLDVEFDSERGHLYVAVADAGGGFNGVRLFDVGTGGALTPRAGAAYTTALPPQDLELSPDDGRNLYLAAGSHLVVLSRDFSSGALTHVQSVSGLSTFDSLAVGPGGGNVYARGPNHLSVYDRNLSSGALTQKLGLEGCLMEEATLPCKPNARGIAGTSLETVVSPDGRHVYTTNQVPGGVAVFNRAADGTLTQPADGCVSVGGTSGSVGGVECAVGPATLAQASAANIDRQGAYVFVSGNGGQTVFRRDGSTGRLTQTDCLDEAGGAAAPAGCREAKGAAGTDAALTPDGNHAALNAKDVGVSFFTFDRSAGTLAQRTNRPCFSAAAAPPCQHAPGLMGGAGGVTIAPNALSVFAASRGGSVASFDLDVAPRCQNKSVTLRKRVPVWIALSCSDLNGDAVTLVPATPPTFGTLGRIDQAKKRIRYIPEDGRRDSFRYRGTARGTAGPPALVTLTIRAPVKTDRKAPNTRITAAPPKVTRSRTARFKFRSTERGSEFQCKPDWRKRWASCSSPKSYGRLRPGRHSFQVRAIDRAGNIDRTPAKRVWRVNR